ncbi:MAG: hypothetical protein Q8O37_15095 [Sulfuricellaceae bacterium]|nr:hypothetical protein [Sulfuricellaceae bacterium]
MTANRMLYLSFSLIMLGIKKGTDLFIPQISTNKGCGGMENKSVPFSVPFSAPFSALFRQYIHEHRWPFPQMLPSKQ